VVNFLTAWGTTSFTRRNLLVGARLVSVKSDLQYKRNLQIQSPVSHKPA